MPCFCLMSQGRFWSDSTLLKLGRFSDAIIHFDHGTVHATIKISFERDGAYLAFENMSLAVEAIRIESISDHSRRWGLLLGTVSGLQWLLSVRAAHRTRSCVAAPLPRSSRHRVLSRTRVRTRATGLPRAEAA